MASLKKQKNLGKRWSRALPGRGVLLCSGTKKKKPPPGMAAALFIVLLCRKIPGGTCQQQINLISAEVPDGAAAEKNKSALIGGSFYGTAKTRQGAAAGAGDWKEWASKAREGRTKLFLQAEQGRRPERRERR